MNCRKGSIFAVVQSSVVPKVIHTTKITPKVVLCTSIVLLNHDIFSKFPYDVIMYNSMYLSSDHFSSTFKRLSESRLGKTIAQNNVFVEGYSSICLESVKTHETSANHIRATQILSVSSGLLARLTTLIKNVYGPLYRAVL